MIRKKSLKKSKRITKLKPTKIKRFQTKKPTPKSRMKKKWADYLISGYNYSSHCRIGDLRRHYDRGDTVSMPGHFITRAELKADLIKRWPKKYETTYYYQGKFHRGSKIKHIISRGKGYIRTMNLLFQPCDELS